MTGYTDTEWKAYEVRRKSWTAYGSISPYHYVACLSTMLRVGKQYDPVRILDVACGDGGMLRIFRDLYEDAFLHGCDSSQSAIAAAAENRINGCTLYTQDLDELESPYGFDLITCNFAWYHMRDHERFLQKASDLLVPGGHLIITTINERSLDTLWEILEDDAEGYSKDCPHVKAPLVQLTKRPKELVLQYMSNSLIRTDFGDIANLKNFVESCMTMHVLADRVTSGMPTVYYAMYDTFAFQKTGDNEWLN